MGRAIPRGWVDAAALGAPSRGEHELCHREVVAIGHLLSFRELGLTQLYVPPLTATLLKMHEHAAQAKQRTVSVQQRVDEYSRLATEKSRGKRGPSASAGAAGAPQRQQMSRPSSGCREASACSSLHACA